MSSAPRRWSPPPQPPSATGTPMASSASHHRREGRAGATLLVARVSDGMKARNARLADRPIFSPPTTPGSTHGRRRSRSIAYALHGISGSAASPGRAWRRLRRATVEPELSEQRVEAQSGGRVADLQVALQLLHVASGGEEHSQQLAI